jgi:hypothetical protein
MTPHNYPPFVSSNPEELDAYIAELLQSKMNAMSEAFTQEWDSREKNLRAENEDLRAQLRSATGQIAAMGPLYVNYISPHCSYY